MELEIGQTAQRTAILSFEDVETYAELTGDRNPLHFDRHFAAGTRFGKLVLEGVARRYTFGLETAKRS